MCPLALLYTPGSFFHPQDSLYQGVQRTLPGHDGVITCICFVNDALFVSADDKGMLRLWKAGNERRVSVFSAAVSRFCGGDTFSSGTQGLQFKLIKAEYPVWR